MLSQYVATAILRHIMRRAVLAFLPVVVLFASLRGLFGLFDPICELSTAQIIVFPLVLAALTWSNPFPKIPATVVAASLSATVLSLVISSLPDRNASILLARLDDDEFEIATRVFRERLTPVLGDKFLIRSTKQPIGKLNKARKSLEESPAQSLIWGRKPWLNISVKEPQVDKVWLDLLAIKPVWHVPVFGLSFEPQNETARFVGLLTRGLLNKDHLSGTSWTEREMALREAGELVAPWSAQAHRAYAWFVLGNSYLERAVRSSYESGEVTCAIEAYRRGAKTMAVRDHPELYAAISNNHAAALFLRYVMEDKREYKHQALERLKLATGGLALKNPYGFKYEAVNVARKNLKRLKERKAAKRLKAKGKKTKLGERGKRKLKFKKKRH